MRVVFGVVVVLMLLLSVPVHALTPPLPLVAGDIDGNGVVDVMDVQLVINAALGIPVSHNTDIDFSGATDVLDVQLVINVALGISIDSDSDGLCDLAEGNLGTEPTNPDTDGDGSPDVQSALAVLSFAIDNGAPETQSHFVNLAVVCSGQPTEYIFSESRTFAGANWSPYYYWYYWSWGFTLSSGNGPKTLYFKVRDGSRESSVVSATITLAQPPPTITAFSIDNGETETLSRDLALTAICSGEPTEYLISESSTFNDADWQSCYYWDELEVEFQLSFDNGPKTIYLKVRNDEGESSAVSTTIMLAQPPAKITAFDIDNGAVETTSPLVQMTADFVVPWDSFASRGVEYMVSESPSFEGATWQPSDYWGPYRALLELSSGNGPKTVYFKVRDGRGESSVVSDTITLNQSYFLDRTWPDRTRLCDFSYPQGIAVTPSGTPYVADTLNHQVHKLSTDGIILASWGTYGADQGQFKYPAGVAVDAVDNVYVADTGNHRIQKFSADGAFLAEWGRRGTDNGQFMFPGSVAVDGSGNVYVSDTGNNRIQKFSAEGDFVGVWGTRGQGNGQFQYLAGIAVDSHGNVYAADYGNGRVQKFSTTGEFMFCFDDQGLLGISPAPTSVAIDRFDNVYVVREDSFHSSLWSDGSLGKFSADGTLLSEWGAWAIEDSGGLDFCGVGVDAAGYVYILDTINGRVAKLTPDRKLSTTWGNYGTANGIFNNIAGIALDSVGTMYAVDAGNNRIQKFADDGTFLTVWGSEGADPGQFESPCGIAVDHLGNVYVTDSWNYRIQKFTSEGTFLTAWGGKGTGAGQFDYPRGIAVDHVGNVYVVDSGNHRVQKFSSDGEFIATWGSEGGDVGQFECPSGIAINAAGDVLVIDTWNNRVEQFTADGAFVTAWDCESEDDDPLLSTSGISTDVSGNVYISDSYDRVRKFTATGVLLTTWNFWGEADRWSSGYFADIAVDASGNVYVVDVDCHRILKFRPE